jgi:hypothetical protein
MQGIQPRSLSNTELIQYAAMLLDSHQGMPKDWQHEVLRRYIALAPTETHLIPQEGQLDLFK